jgi:hypothetical protein
MFGMVTVHARSESSCPIRKGCLTLKMKTLWFFEMSGTADWHCTTWIASIAAEEGLKSRGLTDVAWQNVVKLCHRTVLIAIAVSVSVCCAAQFTKRCTDRVISYLGYRVFSFLRPGGNFCLCYIINKFVLPVWSLNLWLVRCAVPDIFVGIPSILHNTAAALGSWIECELEKWMWGDDIIHAVGHISTSVVALGVLCSKLWLLERIVSQIFACQCECTVLVEADHLCKWGFCEEDADWLSNSQACLAELLLYISVIHSNFGEQSFSCHTGYMFQYDRTILSQNICGAYCCHN